MRPATLLPPRTDPEGEAVALMAMVRAIESDPKRDDVMLLRQFAAVARVRQLAHQQGWSEDVADVEALYADLAARVHQVIEREGVV